MPRSDTFIVLVMAEKTKHGSRYGALFISKYVVASEWRIHVTSEFCSLARCPNRFESGSNCFQTENGVVHIRGRQEPTGLAIGAAKFEGKSRVDFFQSN